jgi:hypothetical protein
MSAIDASAFPSRIPLLVCAIVLPASVAGTNQLLFELLPTYPSLIALLYPWMAFSTAVLSWCTGRYLSPAWLRWIVFAWSLALLDLLTIAACLSGPVRNDFAFTSISAQISLLVLWTISSRVRWQWRLPGAVVGMSLLIVFIGNWSWHEWVVLVWLAAVVIGLVCAGLRLAGFSLQLSALNRADGSQIDSSPAQFGTKHLFLWATALSLLLVAARGLDLYIFARLDATSVFPAAVLSISLAALNLVVIWAILGSGGWFLRVALLVLLPYGLVIALHSLSIHYHPPLNVPWPSSPILSLLIHMEGQWPGWIWLNTILLASLLLFLRASGYRLMRNSR